MPDFNFNKSEVISNAMAQLKKMADINRPSIKKAFLDYQGQPFAMEVAASMHLYGAICICPDELEGPAQSDMPYYVIIPEFHSKPICPECGSEYQFLLTL